jgi:hypothetical protein
VARVVEAELGKEDGRTVDEVAVIDANDQTQKVYVDAQDRRSQSGLAAACVRPPGGE